MSEAADKPLLRVLVSTQDGEDFRLIADFLKASSPDDVALVWEPDFNRSLEAAQNQGYDAVLLDDRPGDKSALSYVREARRRGVACPLLVLTAAKEKSNGREILDAGAAECIPHDRINAFALDHALRCAVLHRRTLDLAYDSEERFRLLFETATEAFLVHAGGTVLEANPAAGLMFGLGTLDLSGLPLEEIFAPESREAVRGLSKTGSLPSVEILGLRKDGSAFPVALRDLPFRTRSRESRLMALADLTGIKDRDKEIQYLLQRLRQDNDRLVQADRIKEEFLSSVTADLRSPLTSINGYLRLLKMEGLGSLTPSQRDALEVSEKNVVRLGQMIDDLLDLSRLDPGSVPLDYLETSIEEIVEMARSTVASLAEAKKISFQIETIPGKAVLDVHKVARVLNHLLANSIKFTPSGGTIRLGVRPQSEGQKTGWLFSVEDNGPGIPDEERDNVFERFYRMDPSPSPRTGGSGVGLAVSRRIVEAHGGRLWAEAAVGGGVAFKMFLPQINP